jgi:ubiquinone/menaquinone biosynthesis C-methylase UbiE
MSSEAKAYKGIGMEGFIARWYASNTRKALPELQALARRVANEIPAVARVLEVAPGPGYLAIELAKLGRYLVSGLDISRTFVDIARRNANEEGVQVDFREGNASRMPFTDGSFDFVLCRAAFKNFAEPDRAVQEMRRVLRPGGRALVIDLRRDASREDIREEVEKMGLDPLNGFVTRMTFRFLLLKRAYSRAELTEFFARAGLRKVRVEEDRIGLEVWGEK